MDSSKAKGLLAKYDADGSGAMDYTEFKDLCDELECGEVDIETGESRRPSCGTRLPGQLKRSNTSRALGALGALGGALNKPTQKQHVSGFSTEIKLVLVHAVNDADGGCEFEHFFSTAPPDLVQAGIFSQIASPLFFHSPAFREVSIQIILDSFSRSASRLQRGSTKHQ